MLKNGTRILSFWLIFNVIPGIISLVMILLGKHAPAFQYFFSVEEVNRLDLRVLQTTDGVAIIANALIISYCLLSFFVVRKCLVKREKWSLWVLAGSILIVQIASYWSDSQFAGKNIWIVNISSLIFSTGLGLCFYDLFSGEQFSTSPKGSKNA